MIKILIILITFVGGIYLPGLTYARFDPTRPPTYRESKGETFRPSDLIVNAIIIAQNRKIVIVNNQIHKIGDILSGIQITDIERHQVIFHGPEGYFSIPVQIDVRKTLQSQGQSI